MTTESPIRMLESSESKNWLSSVDSTVLSSPFSNAAGREGFDKSRMGNGVLSEQTHMPSRSGSAPPTVEGSIAAFRSFVDARDSSLMDSRNNFLECESEEQMRTDPAYIAYYYSKVNLNPRLSPPLISRENRHLVRFMGGFGHKNIPESEGLLATHKEETEEDLSQPTFSDRKQTTVPGHDRNMTDMIKEDFFQAPYHASASSAVIRRENDPVNVAVATADQKLRMQEPYSGPNNVLTDILNVDYHTVASVSCTDIPATASPCLKNADSEDDVSTRSNIGSDISVVESRMKSLDISGDSVAENEQNKLENSSLHDDGRLPDHPLQNTAYQVTGSQTFTFPHGMYALQGGMEKLASAHPELPVMLPFMHNLGPAPPLYATPAAYLNSANLLFPNLMQPGFPSPQFGLGGPGVSSGFHPSPFRGYLQNAAYPMHMGAPTVSGFFKPPMQALTGEMNPYVSHMMYLNKHHTQHELMQRPLGNALQGQYFHPGFQDAQRGAVQHNLAPGKDSGTASLTGTIELSHPAAGTLNVPATNRTHISVNFYGYPPSVGMPQFLASSPPAIPGSPISGSYHPGLRCDLNAAQYSPRSSVAPSSWKGQRDPESSDDCKRNSFLELLKSSGSKKLELSDISGQIVEFSVDQHGSRFIQQKLEQCSMDEKDSVFKEVLPYAAKLMTDVFGNYVIQKFFEHGTPEHRRYLGEQLTGQIVSLSLQMYGCRVIQKALEVIELDQKVELVQELDGHVMKCVHDQNGNHVIQKCIEAIPAEKIGFIISSFHGQVAALSSHPYGCRVIQRILEHCSDEQISRCIVDEILESTCTLAQDPYGNYVTQHVLEMGKSHERSQIILKLTGKFVQMSHHKFASNVIEKCLKYGDASERELVIEEIIAQSDNNTDALLMMMKDQFANYVVQKILDISTGKHREILLNCIQSHLPVLKRFTYAKQIVARYEQLTEGSLQEQK